MKTIPDLWEGCYDGEHRKLLVPEQFKQMFCDVCLNAGCRNSRGAGMKWSQRMLTQEDRLLHNPNYAPPDTATVMGLPDFPDMLREALAIEISDRRGDWEPVTDAEVGRAAAELMGVVTPSSPAGFKPEPEPKTLTCGHPLEADPAHSDPNPYATHYCMICQALAEALEPEQEPEPEPVASNSDPADPTTVTPEQNSDPGKDPAAQEPAAPLTGGTWRVQGDTKDAKGKRLIYDVTLHKDGSWECSCPSREVPCKHARDIDAKRARAAAVASRKPAPDPTRPQKKSAPPRPSFNTNMPSGGVMVGGGPPPPAAPDPWSAPTGPKDRVIGVGGKITFGSNKDK